MSYSLKFKEEALKEWGKLDSTIKAQFKNKLQERLLQPRVVASLLSGKQDRYKIKLRGVGYRLVYEVRDDELVVVVVAVGKRERNAVYKAAARGEHHAKAVIDLDLFVAHAGAFCDAEPSVEANIQVMDTDRDGMVSVSEIKVHLQKQFGQHYKQSLLERMEFFAKSQSCDSSFTRPLSQ